MDLDLSIIIEILKIGLPGLVFLLSLLAYKLLSGVEATENPNKEVLKIIKSYMYLNVLLAALTLASPIIEYKLSEKSGDLGKSETFTIFAIAASSGQEVGEASVCIDEKYIGRYLLVKDPKSPDLIIQVKASRVIPCTKDKKIILSTVDAAKLGWTPSTAGTEVEVVTALPGYMFITS